MHCIVQQEWNAGIYLFNNELRNLDLIYRWRLSEQFIAVTSHYDENSDHLKYVKSGKPAFIEFQLPVKLGEIELKENLQSFILLPLINKEIIIGCINLASHQNIVLPIHQQKGLKQLLFLLPMRLKESKMKKKSSSKISFLK